jgi:hypothetical protein
VHNEVELFIEDLIDNQKVIMQQLHPTITSFPEVISKIRYKIPFYYRKSWICYLNPVKGDKVELAFTRGNELSNEQGLLQANGRKQVRGVIIENANDIPWESLNEIFQEAFLLDEEIKYASKRKKF